MPAYLLLGAFRNLWRNKLNSVINLASLALGLAVFSFAFLYVKEETGYDRSWPDAGRIHRLTLEQHGLPGNADGTFNTVVPRAYEMLSENFPDQIDKITRVYSIGVSAADAQQPFFTNLSIVDPAFNDIFKPELVSGSLETVLKTPGFVAIEESVAARYPDGPLKLGSRITVEGQSFGPNKAGRADYEVGAIFRVPKPSSTFFLAITLKDDHSLPLLPSQGPNAGWNGSVGLWITLKPNVSLDAWHALMPDYLDRAVTPFVKGLKPGDRVSSHLSYRFQPITDIHFHPVGFERNDGDASRVLTIAAIGVLVLLVGCSNSISLSLATVMERRRDIGIHKAVGALQRDILLQYLGEAVLLALLALAPALGLVHWLLPVFQTLLNIRNTVTPGVADYATLIAIAALVGLVGGAYPALVLAKVKPQHVLKAGTRTGSRSTHVIRLALVGFQFCFAVMLMVAMLSLLLQLKVVRDQPLGFSVHNLVSVFANSEAERSKSAALLEELRKLSGVVRVSNSVQPPNSDKSAKSTNIVLFNNAATYINRSKEPVEASLDPYVTNGDQFSMLQIPLIAGHLFNREDLPNPTTPGLQGANITTDKHEARVILNRTAVKVLGFTDPQAAIGQFIFSRNTDREGKVSETPALVVGVVEDSMWRSLRRKPAPEVYTAVAPSGFGSFFLLQFAEGADKTIEQDMKRVWQQVTGVQARVLTFVEPQMAAEFAAEKNESRLLLYCAGLALFLSCIGLFGLASFTMQRGVKEVGVRKVMGASVLSLTSLYLWRYAKPVLIASAIASPVAVYFVLQWLQRFPYQLEKWWLLPLCIAACGTVLVIALLTVAGIVVKTANGKPVESLRYE